MDRATTTNGNHGAVRGRIAVARIGSGVRRGRGRLRRASASPGPARPSAPTIPRAALRSGRIDRDETPGHAPHGVAPRWRLLAGALAAGPRLADPPADRPPPSTPPDRRGRRRRPGRAPGARARPRAAAELDGRDRALPRRQGRTGRAGPSSATASGSARPTTGSSAATRTRASATSCSGSPARRPSSCTTSCSSGSRSHYVDAGPAGAAGPPRARQPGGRPPRPELPPGQRRRRRRPSGSPGSATRSGPAATGSTCPTARRPATEVVAACDLARQALGIAAAAGRSWNSSTAPATSSTTTRAT